ncbi:Retrovirus-related Pol polyprotein from transposon gypsy [Trichinella spiralis]|uniref:Retrovirus-related Pol polyprotein from transposon gypsy n=1 Tax=Trichinella spiralis TaxID=6334 RepID=A0ABR3K3U4_TRISP
MAETQQVSYASRSLSQPERKYCATRREMLALVWTTRHFQPFLYDRDREEEKVLRVVLRRNIPGVLRVEEEVEPRRSSFVGVAARIQKPAKSNSR